MTDLLEKVRKYIESHETVTFAELHVRFQSGKEPTSLLGKKQFKNLWIGYGTPEMIEVINKLMRDRLVYLAPCHFLLYLCDGGPILTFPIAKRGRSYKSDRWFPTCIHPTKTK